VQAAGKGCCSVCAGHACHNNLLFGHSDNNCNAEQTSDNHIHHDSSVINHKQQALPCWQHACNMKHIQKTLLVA
jgi:hypothetical protein